MWTFSHINRSKFVFKTTVYYIYNKIRSNQTNEQNTVHWTLSKKIQTSLFFQNIEHPQPPTPHTHTDADILIWKIFE